MKVNNNGIKSVLVSISLVATVGGWAALGNAGRQQALAEQDYGQDNPEVVDIGAEAVDQVSMPEVVPVTLLLVPDTFQSQAIQSPELPTVPEIVPQDQRKMVEVHEIPPLPTYSGLTQDGESLVGGSTGTSDTLGTGRTIQAEPLAFAPIPIINQRKEAKKLTLPAFEPLPALPSSSLEPLEPLPALDLPPVPKVSAPTQQQSRTVIRTRSSR